jgi:hypothetical protein
LASSGVAWVASVGRAWLASAGLVWVASVGLAWVTSVDLGGTPLNNHFLPIVKFWHYWNFSTFLNWKFLKKLTNRDFRLIGKK